MRRDTLHLKAPGNWINDPNGFICYRGKYHLFYQHFPYAPVWGTMHWGHAVSEDLVYWEHRDIALFPTKEYDKNGIFSGSAIEKDGKLFLYYSAVRYLETDPEDIHRAVRDRYETSQAMLISEDGEHFDNWGAKRQILPVIRDEAMGHAAHTRDPKVWLEGGRYYMALGSTYLEKEGRVLFYRSADGERWEYGGQCRDKRLGRIVECPDVFSLGETDAFLASLMYAGQAQEGYEHLAVCGPARFDPDTCRLTLPEQFQYVDYGMDLYAPQTTLDREGRRVMVGWMRMPGAVEGEEKPWNGMMCLPRVVEAKDGHIFFRVHPQVDLDFSGQEMSRETLPENVPCRIRAALAEGESLEIGGFLIRREEGSVRTDRSRVFPNSAGAALTCATPRVTGRCSLDIFVDPNLIEVFVNDGEYVISNVVYGLGKRVTGNISGIYTESQK